MPQITKEQARRLRNDFECWQQDYDPKEDKEQYDMFGLGMAAMDMLIAGMYQEPVVGDIGEIRVGRLPTMNQDEYPGLGDWWVQLRIGDDYDEVLARVYGATPQEANIRAEALASRAATLQLFGNSEHVSNRDELPGWIKCSERMPGIGTRVLICDVERSGVYEAIRFDGNRFNRFGCEIIADYWQPLPAAAPQQEPQ